MLHRRHLRFSLVSLFSLFVLGGCAGSSTPTSGDTSVSTGTVGSLNPVPAIASLSPAVATAGDPAFTLTVNGTGFGAGATVQWNGTARSTTVVSATQLTASIPATDTASAGSSTVTVTNPAPGGGTSNASAFTINSRPPTLVSLAPASVAAGGAAFTLTVNGSGFVSGATVSWNGAARTTSFVSATQLSAAISASDVATVGTAAVDVVQGSLRSSNQLNFAVITPVPSLVSLSPATASAGGAAFTLTITGSQFTSGAAILWNGSARPTSFVSATQLTAAISASDIGAAGTASIDVVQSGVHAAAMLSFTVTQPAARPTITSLNPGTVIAGAGAFPLQIKGSGFSANSLVSWNGGRLATTLVSSTELNAAVTADLDVTASTISIVVTNPDNEGGVSASAAFYVNPAPVGKLVQLVSSSYLHGGSPSNNSGYAPTLSQDGRYAGYLSAATDLIADDTNGENDGYVTDTCVGGSAPAGCIPTNSRVSLDVLGAQYPSGGASNIVVLSSDGRLAAYDRHNDVDTEIRDTCAGVTGCSPSTSIVSIAPAADNAPPDQVLCCSRLSPDGRYVMFTKYLTNPDNTSTAAIYVRDNCFGATGCTPFTQRVALGKAATAPRQPFQHDVSSGGRYVLFQADGNTVDPALTSVTHKFVQDTCIGAPAGCTVTYTLVDVRSDGTESQAGAAGGASSFSKDGRYIAFISSDQKLVAGRTINNGQNQYLRDTCNGAPAGCVPSTILVSEPSTGTNYGSFGDGYRSVSEHGRYVAYTHQGDNPLDFNQVSVVVRDTCIGAPSGCVPSSTIASADPDGINPVPNSTYYYPSISADGHYVAFKSAEGGYQLGQVYLARTGY